MSWSADFPVALTGEIDGTVYLEEGDERRAAAGVELELVAADGEVAARCRSQFDGFYLFERISPGRYTLRQAGEQAARLGLGLEPREVEIAGGEIANGVDLLARSGSRRSGRSQEAGREGGRGTRPVMRSTIGTRRPLRAS